MEVCILRKFEYPPRLAVIMEFYAKFRVYMSEPFDAAIFTGSNDSSRLGEFGFPSSHVLGVVQFIISPVFKGTVGMNARFMRKGVGSDTRLADRDREIEGIGRILRNLPGFFQICMLIKRHFVFQSMGVL